MVRVLIQKMEYVKRKYVTKCHEKQHIVNDLYAKNCIMCDKMSRKCHKLSYILLLYIL